MNDFEICRIEIENFGKFKQKTFDFKSGLNVIYGQNESGKTTVLDFIIYMLYGAERRKNIYENGNADKFIPWNSDYTAGSMDYVYDGKHYRIQRFDKGSIHKLDVTDNDTLMPVYFKTSPGAEMFGFGADGFVRTYFIGAATTVINDDKDGSIADKLSKITSCSDGGATYTIIKKNLCTRINTYTSKRYSNPVIPTLEAQLCEAKMRAKKLEDAKDEANLTARELPTLKNELKKCDDIIQKNSEYSEFENKIKLNEAYFDLKNKYENAEREISSDRIKVFENITDKELNLMQSDGDSVLSDIISKISRFKSVFVFSRIFAVLFGVLCAVFTVVLAVGVNIMPLTVFCALIFIVFLCIMFISNSLYKNADLKHNTVLHTISGILGETDTNSAEEFNRFYGEWNERGCPDYDECLKKFNEIKGKYEDLLNTIKKRYELSDIIHLDKSSFSYNNYMGDFQNETKDVYKRADSLKKRIFELENILKASNDSLIDNAYKDIKLLSEKLDAAKTEKAVYETALKLLEKANSEISTVFAPKLSAAASNIFMSLTDGAYDTVTVNSNLQINVKEGMRFMPSNYYSLAAREQMYLALRLGIIKTINDKTLTVFIDDSFAFYDNIRLKAAYARLADISNGRQIIYTLCRKNDLEMLKTCVNKHNINFILLSD